MKKFFSYALSVLGCGSVQSNRSCRFSGKLSLLGVFLTTSLVCFPHSLFAQGRYAAESINAEADGFYSRFNKPLINADFIILAVKDSASYKIGDTLDGNGIEQTAAGSIIIQPGVDIGNVDIININEGDNDIIAIGNR